MQIRDNNKDESRKSVWKEDRVGYTFEERKR